MPELVQVVAAFALVLVLPGVLVLVALPVRLTVLEWVALVPACSLGAVFVIAEFVMLVGLPFGPAAFVATVALLAIAAGSRILHGGWCRPVVDRHREVNRQSAVQRAGLPVALGLLVIAIVIGGITWLQPSSGKWTTAPGSDAIVHGFMIRRIADTETISSKEVLVTDPVGKDQGFDYYPLSLHASLAMANRLTDAPIGYLLNATIVLFAALVLPLSLFAMTRHLIPGEPLAAGFAAVIGSLITMFPYQPVSWGLIPLTAAMALVPVTVLLILRTVSNGWSRSAAGLSALVIAGVFTLHNSEVPLILALVGVILLFSGVRQVPWRDVVTRLLWIGFIGAVLLAPTLPEALTGVGTRQRDFVGGKSTVEGFLGELLTLSVYVPRREGWLVVLAGAGIAVLLWRRDQLGWIISAAGIGGLAILAATSHSAITTALTYPWYRDEGRVSYNLIFFVPIFAGVLIGLGSRWIAERVSPRTLSVPAVAIVLLALLWPAGGARALEANRDMVSDSYTFNAPIRRQNVAAFDFMRAHSRRNQTVLTDLFIDSGSWMYPLAGVNPLFGVTTRNRALKERVFLRDHIVELGDNKRVDDIVRKLGVRFVYFGEQTMRQLGPHWLTLDMLRSTPRLREVFNRDGAHVFEISRPA